MVNHYHCKLYMCRSQMVSIATVTKGCWAQRTVKECIHFLLYRHQTFTCNNPHTVSPSLHLPPSSPSGHQQSVQLSEGGPPAASGPGGQETGPLPGVRCCCAGPAGLRVWTGGSLACLHLVNCFYFVGSTVTEGTFPHFLTV